MELTLRDYQIKNAEKLSAIVRKYDIAVFCAEMRTGKTLTALYLAEILNSKTVLFVTKLKAISSIEKDFKDFSFDYKIKIINYDQLHNVTDNFDFIVVDECHSLGSFPKPSNRVIELRRIAIGAKILLMSGTITPESYSQFYHQFYVSTSSPFLEYKNFYNWHKVYGIAATKFVFNRTINDYSKTKKDLVIDKIKHLMISYTQEEAGFKCEVKEFFCEILMSEKIRQSISLLKKTKIFRTKDGNVILADTAVKEMQKIHQLCSGTVKDEDGNGIVFDTSKIDYIKENFKGKKIAIFYKYIAEGVALKWHFAGQIVEDAMEFNNSSKDKVFLSQIQSGREGINLSSADCLIMYNIDFSALSYWQGRARMQTLNRIAPAELYWLFTQNGIEKKIYEVVQQKKDFTLSHYKKY